MRHLNDVTEESRDSTEERRGGRGEVGEERRGEERRGVERRGEVGEERRGGRGEVGEERWERRGGRWTFCRCFCSCSVLLRGRTEDG